MKRKVNFILLLIFLAGVFIILGSFPRQEELPETDCGNEICEIGENQVTCIIDCKNPRPLCGNKLCEVSENKITCPLDCKTTPSLSLCGNEVCDPIESSYTCIEDCGSPPLLCGDNKCEVGENEIYCPDDCFVEEEDIVMIPEIPSGCGDEICSYSETEVTCPLDCGIIVDEGLICPLTSVGFFYSCFDNHEIVQNLIFNQRPISAGLEIKMDFGLLRGIGRCTLGAIVKRGGKYVLLTASHCIKGDVNNAILDSSDIGLDVIQYDSNIGRFNSLPSDNKVDVAYVDINSDIEFTTYSFLGDNIKGFADVYKGMKVFKIGRTTGLTFGTITDVNVAYKFQGDSLFSLPRRGFAVVGDSGDFSEPGDSGAGIITLEEPPRLVGFVSGGPVGSSLTYSNYPRDIINSLNLEENF